MSEELQRAYVIQKKLFLQKKSVYLLAMQIDSFFNHERMAKPKLQCFRFTFLPCGSILSLF